MPILKVFSYLELRAISCIAFCYFRAEGDSADFTWQIRQQFIIISYFKILFAFYRFVVSPMWTKWTTRYAFYCMQIFCILQVLYANLLYIAGIVCKSSVYCRYCMQIFCILQVLYANLLYIAGIVCKSSVYCRYCMQIFCILQVLYANLLYIAGIVCKSFVYCRYCMQIFCILQVLYANLLYIAGAYLQLRPRNIKILYV